MDNIKMPQINLELVSQIQECVRKTSCWLNPILSKFAAINKQITTKIVPYIKYGILYLDHYYINDEKFYIEFEKLVAETSKEKIVKFVIDFYSQDNWCETDRLFSEWLQYTILQNRSDILKSCFRILFSSQDDGINIEDKARVIIPTLIAQLEGIIVDFYMTFPNHNRQRSNTYPITFLSDKGTDSENFWKNYSYADYAIFADPILILFASGKEKDKKTTQELSEYSLYRHKILHGDPECISYGKKENIIRLILYVDCCLKFINAAQKN